MRAGRRHWPTWSRVFVNKIGGLVKGNKRRDAAASQDASQPIARPISDLWMGGRGDSPPINISSSKDALGGLAGVE